MAPLMSCRQCHLCSVKCDRGRPCSTCVDAGRECTYDKVMVNGRGLYLRDDGRTRHGKHVTPDDPAAAPSAAAVEASAPGGVYDSTLPIAPPHLWRGFSGPSVFTTINASCTPFPWTPRAEGVSLSLRQHSSLATAEQRIGNADGVGHQETDEEMSEEDEEEEEKSKGHTANKNEEPPKKKGWKSREATRLEVDRIRKSLNSKA